MVRVVIAVGIVLIVLTQSAFVINEGEQGLVLQFGKLVKIVRDPGLYFKYPFIQDLHRFDKRILVADARPAEYITLDKKRLTVDSVSRWKIADPFVFYRTVRDYRGAIARLNDVIFGRLRQEIANHRFKDFIREERENIMRNVTDGTKEAAVPFGIQVVDVRIKRLDLPQEVQASVFDRMKAERERIAKRYRAEGAEKAKAIRAEADKTRAIILAEAYKKSQEERGAGDAEATTIYAEAYGRDKELYSFLRHLEVYRKIFGKQSTLLLRPDSPLMRFLDNPKGAAGNAPGGTR
jgi:membrane protease subunit HflC